MDPWRSYRLDGVDQSYFFTPEGEDFEWFYAQHNVSILDNGDIALFDNGTAKVKRVDGDNRVSGDNVYSRAVVYQIDTENMTVSQVTEYGKERGATGIRTGFPVWFPWMEHRIICGSQLAPTCIAIKKTAVIIIRKICLYRD